MRREAWRASDGDDGRTTAGAEEDYHHSLRDLMELERMMRSGDIAWWKKYEDRFYIKRGDDFIPVGGCVTLPQAIDAARKEPTDA